LKKVFSSFFATLVAVFAFSATAKTIFVIESYHEDYPWVKEYRKGLEHTLGSEHELVYFEMDTKRLGESDFTQRADEAWVELVSVSPDFVIVADDNALELLAPKLNTLDQGYVFLGINGNPRHYGVNLSRNSGGVLERPEIRASIAQLQEISPFNKVLIISEKSTTSDTILKYMLGGEVRSSIANVQVDFLEVKHFEDWKNLVMSADDSGYDAIFVGLYQALKDSSEQPVNGDDVIQWTSQNATTPLFALYDYAIGPEKALGGLVLSGYDQGVKAGQLTTNYFEGVKNAPLPVSTKNVAFIFSKTQMEKWQLNIPEHLRTKVQWVD
jgi:hypothetical protein